MQGDNQTTQRTASFVEAPGPAGLIPSWAVARRLSGGLGLQWAGWAVGVLSGACVWQSLAVLVSLKGFPTVTPRLATSLAG